MTTHQLSLNECNTPWWYETPSLASQSTFSSNTYCTGTSQIDPFDITPSQSSGYYDEDTTASEASSNMFTGAPGSGATGSEWSENGSSMRSVIKSTRWSHHRPSAMAGGAEGGACLCEHCASHSGVAHARVHHNQMGTGYESQTQTQTSDHSNTSEIPIAPVSPTAPLSSFNSMEMSDLGATPSTCTELNGLVDSQDGLDEQENRHSGECCDSSSLSDGEQRGSQLSHSMASTNQQILRELARDLMQHIDSIKIFPYLQRNSLLSDDDMEYICNPRRTENERRRRIIVSAPCRDPDAFDRFVDCLSVERSHPGHSFLAKRMREAIKKKRENPFKTMSSLRKKRGTSGRHHSEGDAHSVRRHPDDVQDQLSSSAQSSPKHFHSREHDPHVSSKSQSPRPQQRPLGGSSVRHEISSTSSTTAMSSSPRFSEKDPSPSPYEIPTPSATPVSMASHITASSGRQPHYSRRSPGSSSGVSSYTHTPSSYQLPPDEQEATLSEEEYERSFYEMYKRDHFDSYNQPGGYSSLPRQFSNSNVSSLSRCSPAYSSARYQAEQKRKAKSLNRHGSFHSHNDVSPAHLVSPLTRSTATNDSSVPPYHQSHPHSHDYQRKYSLPVTSQHGPTFTSTLKSHSGSQLPNIHNSPYPPLQEDMGSALISNDSCTQGDYLVSDATLTEYGFSPFYSQWENQTTTTHPPQQYELSGHNYERPSPSLNDSRSRHPSLPPETSGYSSQYPSLQSDEYFQSITDIQGGIDELSLQSHQSAERTHRRSRSCDASKAQREGLVPSPPEEIKSRHHSLIRRQHRPSYDEVKRERIAGKETGDAKLIKRKILWLQERVQFTEFFEELNFLSLTHYRQPRDILYSGTLYEHGKPRFVVLLTDMLLILKPKKKIKMNMVPSKLGVQMPQLDWFSDLGCKAKRPFFLHLMMVQKKLKKYSSECFSIRYNNRSEMVEITFQAVSKEAKEIWVESLSQAIRTCTEDNANSILPVGNPSASNKQSGQPYTKLSLTVLQANNLALSSSNCKTRNHYCSVHLGSQKCRTPSVKAKCWPSWNFQLVFSNFAVTEIVHVGFFTERTTCPDDFLGNVEIDLTTLAQSQRRQLQQSVDRMSKLLFKNQVYPLMNGKGTLTFDIELSWETNL